MICFLSPCSRVPATSAGWHGIQLFAVRRSRTPQPKTNHPRKMGLAVNHLGKYILSIIINRNDLCLRILYPIDHYMIQKCNSNFYIKKYFWLILKLILFSSFFYKSVQILFTIYKINLIK